MTKKSTEQTTHKKVEPVQPVEKAKNEKQENKGETSSKSKKKKESTVKKPSARKIDSDKSEVILIDKKTGEKVLTTNATIAEIKKEIDISPYISNVEGNVYAISGLPEEFVATLFAWVSRSPKSFKEHLSIALQEQDIQTQVNQFRELDDKAKRFHEKWTVGYGHSSVSENATAHVGVEKISRLASAELELSNTFLSLTEYSQRYQKPKRGEWYKPFEWALEKPQGMSTANVNINPLYQKYDEFMDFAFDTFEKLVEGVFKYLKEKNPEEKDSVLEKLAFEDARYVLPLSMYTQLGMTANGRAWRDGIAKLGTSLYPEVHKLADDLRVEITKVLPVLLKYASPSKYQLSSEDVMRNTFNGVSKSKPEYRAMLHSVKPEGYIIDEIIAHLYVQYEGRTFDDGLRHVYTLDPDKKKQIIHDILENMEHFDMAPDAFRHVYYKADFSISEANWHQLLRHNRMTDFSYGRPSVHHGVTIPPRIIEAGLEQLVYDVVNRSTELYEQVIRSDKPALADYVVLNAHKRQITATFSLWEAYHLINLRTSEEAQWDIREVFTDLFKQIQLVHPTLISKAQRR